ncbi:hypothetical protein Dimus_012622 [Dionaea muscipula]
MQSGRNHDCMSLKTPSPIFNHPILETLKKCKSLSTLKQIHAQMITTGLVFHTFPISCILRLCSRFSLTYALGIFSQVPNQSIFLYNTLISSICNYNHHVHIVMALYTRILYQPHIRPNSYTFPSLFKVFCSHPWFRHGQALHTHVLKFLGSNYDPFVQASLINYYSKCGKLGYCRYLFDQIRQPDLAMWNTMLSAYSRSGAGDANFINGFGSVEDADLSLEVLNLFRKMQCSLVKPNEVTFVALIGACADLGALSEGIWAHVYLSKHKLGLNRFLVTALVDMYAKCGSLSMAFELFDEFPQKDELCYNAMISGFATHGHGHRALDLFKRMGLEGLSPDDVTLAVTISACSHVGLVKEGCSLFESMEKDHKITPKLEHYSCLVDLLGRAGLLKEAEERIQNMPMKPNAFLWRSLLGAARLHGDLVLGEVALEHLIELEPETSGNYVLMSNMYARIGKWEDVNRVRRLMKQKGIDKLPGCSLIEIHGVVHEFFTRDKRHPRSVEIYLKMEEMNEKLQAYGYTPSTHEVLFDIEEEEKEDALSYHSERLAIAIGLIALQLTVPIRIIKNLRVCSDCHVSTKLISKIYGREIIVRDRNRFHHFRNGTCSCLDYW